MMHTEPTEIDGPPPSPARRGGLALATAVVVTIVLGLAILFAYPIIGAVIGFEAY
jgi:hypothetical protein